MNIKALSLINILEVITGDMFSLTTESGISATIEKALRSMFYSINTLIYKLIIMLYNIFESISNSRLLDNDTLNQFAERIGYLLGIIMLFIVIFNFIKMLLDPDKLEDKESGAMNVIKKVLFVIIMLGVSSFGFKSLWDIQKYIIQEKVLYKIILPSDKQVDTENFGSVLAIRTFNTFYNVEPALQGSEDKDIEDCEFYYGYLQQEVIMNENFNVGKFCLNSYVKAQKDEKGNQVEYFIMNYNYFLQLVMGIILVYLLASYVFKVGIRVIQLTVLEIIAPMAIISNLSLKKDNIYTRWQKMYFATYIDVFIRLAIIYFVIFLSALLLDSISGTNNLEFFNTLGPNGEKYRLQIIIIMIFALLSFAKKAPDLIKELLPNQSSSKIGFGAGFKDIIGTKTATSIIGGAAGGAAIGLLGGGIGGFAGGLLKGGLSGFKGQGLGKTAASAWKNQVATNKRVKEWKADGGGLLPFGRWGAAFNQWRGADTTADIYDREKSDLETENAAYKAFDGYLDAAEKRAEAQILKGAYDSNSHTQEAMKQKNLAEIYRQQSANIKRSDYDSDADYNKALTDLANKASAADSLYLREMKNAKKDYISDILSGEEKDAPTLQNLQQAAGVVAANRNNNYSGFAGINQQSLLTGNYDTFDGVNIKSKAQQSVNNNRLVENQNAGRRARANAKYSGRK